MPERPGDSDGIENLLHRLNSADAGAAWAAFIDRYSGLIMKVVRQFEYGQERDTECFLHVCEKLCERRFRRLQKFDPGGDAKFPNWLGTVVFNLCIDWHRAEFGRATMSPAIAALPAFDQLVYHYCYEQGMSRETCYQAIEADFPGMSFDHIAASLGRIHALLTPRQRWRLSLRRGRETTDPSGSIYRHIPDPHPDPETWAEASEEAAQLEAALGELPGDQRLLLHLRFQEGLTYSRIAQAEHLGNPHRARRQVQAALDALYLALRRLQSGQKRQK